MLELVIFYLFAVFTIISGCAILFSTSIVRMTYWLIGMLMTVAGLYFLLGAYFLGVIQILIYVGGMAVLMIFGVMLTAQRLSSQLLPNRGEAIWLTGISLTLLLGLVAAVLDARWSVKMNPAANRVADIGKSLLGDFLGPFELASILLLAALLGAAYLVRPKVPIVESDDTKKYARVLK